MRIAESARGYEAPPGLRNRGERPRRRHHQKYIVPEEGTLDVALMFLPRKRLLRTSHDRRQQRGSLWTLTAAMNTSSLFLHTLYAHLHVIAMGLRGMQMEETPTAGLESLSGMEKRWRNSPTSSDSRHPFEEAQQSLQRVGQTLREGPEHSRNHARRGCSLNSLSRIPRSRFRFHASQRQEGGLMPALGPSAVVTFPLELFLLSVLLVPVRLRSFCCVSSWGACRIAVPFRRIYLFSAMCILPALFCVGVAHGAIFSIL